MVDLVPLPPAEAIAAFLERGGRLDPTFHWTDKWQDEHARAFTVAKSAGFDVLADIHAALDRALKEGLTPEQFADELRPILQAKGWWGRRMVRDPDTGELISAQLGSPRRLRTIFDVNMRVSYAAGHWAAFERRKGARPFLRYVAILDDVTRPQHRALHNLVLPVDHPFWNEYAPPNGWNCRCTLQSLSQGDIDRLVAGGEDLRFEPPPVVTRPWTNQRTGETIEVPEGIDPGFGHNPGKAGWRASQGTAFAGKVAAAPPALAEAAINERVSSDDFLRFLGDPAGDMPVFLLPAEAASALGAKSRVGLLSAETMLKQLRHHPELTADEYRRLPEIGTRPALIVQDGAQTVVLVQQSDGRWYHAAVKVTANGAATYMTSFRRTDDRSIARLLARGISILFDGR